LAEAVARQTGAFVDAVRGHGGALRVSYADAVESDQLAAAAAAALGS
jgi:hypothetical protein